MSSIVKTHLGPSLGSSENRTLFFCFFLVWWNMKPSGVDPLVDDTSSVGKIEAMHHPARNEEAGGHRRKKEKYLT